MSIEAHVGQHKGTNASRPLLCLLPTQRLLSTHYTHGLQSTLRKQLLGRLHHAEGRSLEGQKPSSIQEQVMNTVFAEYLGACQRTNTLSVFLAEASLCDSVHLTHEDILASLRIPPSSQLYQRIMSALSDNKENGVCPSWVHRVTVYRCTGERALARH